MRLVTINSGSTSIKLAAFEASVGAAHGPAPLRPLVSVHHEGTHLEPVEELRAFLKQLSGPPSALAHRVVHGADRFTHPVRIDDTVRASIAELAALAPLHNPLALRWIDAARQLCDPTVVQVAVFDTAYFATLPRVAAEYALPPSLGWDVGVRRYGFHGLAHEAMWHRWCELNPGLQRGGRLISLQLGGGCSITARGPQGPQDTSMGFSPLEGLVMASRCGDVDAAVVPYLSERCGLSPARLLESFNREAGLLGLAGHGSPSELLEAGGARAERALELYCYRLRKYIGAYLAVLGGCDGIVFGGGVGEHVPQIRARVLEGLRFAGVALDDAANEAAVGREGRISAPHSAIAVWTVSVAEEPLLASAALQLVGSQT
ncbi:MAG: acetate/propionate family kinase [Steroidobacteraceae bacterium]